MLSRYPFSADQEVQTTDWEQYIVGLANDIVTEQSPKKYVTYWNVGTNCPLIRQDRLWITYAICIVMLPSLIFFAPTYLIWTYWKYCYSSFILTWRGWRLGWTFSVEDSRCLLVFLWWNLGWVESLMWEQLSAKYYVMVNGVLKHETWMLLDGVDCFRWGRSFMSYWWTAYLLKSFSRLVIYFFWFHLISLLHRLGC